MIARSTAFVSFVTPSMNRQTMKTVKLQIADLDQKVLPGWSVVAATGFRMPLNHPTTVKTALCDKWGITTDYLDQRIQTLLLNSCPVDDPEAIDAHPGDILTLSGAMPGLAGAILRKGGVLAGMRHSISANNENAIETKDQWVTVKLFNLVIDDLRGLFLGKGIVLTARQAVEFVGKITTSIPQGNWQLWIDGHQVPALELQTLGGKADFVKIVISLSGLNERL